MCSETCPCSRGAGDRNSMIWGNIENKKLRSYSRAANKGQMSNAENKDYLDNGIYASIVPFEW